MNRKWHLPTLTWVVLATIIFTLILSAAMGLVIRHEHQGHLEFTKNLADGQMEAIGLITEIELQKGSYDTLNTVFNQWAGENNEIDEITLISKNGFVIASYGPINPSERRYIIRKEIPYSYRGRANLMLAQSLEGAYMRTQHLGLEMLAVIAVLSGGFFLLTHLFLSRRHEARLLSLAVIELRESESHNLRLAAYPQENPNPIIAFDLDGKMTFKNPACSMLMRRLNEVDIRAILPDEHKKFITRIRDGENQLFTEKLVGRIHLLAHYQMIDVANEIYVYIQDITAQRRAESELRKERNQARTTLGSIGDGVISVNRDVAITYLNTSAEKLCRLESREVLGKSFSEVITLIDEDEGGSIDAQIISCLGKTAGEAINKQASLVLPDGEQLNVDVTATSIISQDDEMRGVVIVLRDVTREKRLQGELHRQAKHDSLTDLMNRSAFESHLENALESARSRDHEHILCFMDLDQFKVVNDTCGHVAGDELLRQLAVVMRKHFRGSDVLARIGGDEFSAILIDCPMDRAIERIDSLRGEVQEHIFNWENHSFRITLSIGVVPIDQYSESTARLMSTADAACYTAKDSGRNCINVYERDGASTKLRLGEMQWVARINSALEDDRLTLYAQPIVELNRSEAGIVALEILVRMRGTDNELIPPGAFLPAAERYDLIERIDHWVIEKVMCELSACQGATPDCFINLSGATLSRNHIAPYLKRMFEKYSVNPSQLTFEVTETVAIQNLSSAIQMIHELRAIGCRFALDDFGSGLSSFGYLKNLPLDFVKIDGMFVKDMHVDPLDRSMVEAIHTVASTMKLTTIAEFVENDEVKEELRIIGIDLGQGYGIAHPKPFTEYISGENGSNVIWLRT
ncbi:MAG: EAL domain-containing protein [Candidatus Thiodiazotropha sp. (ex Myrtea sp. 'scaly one' KF741663)]|nr:EAL domain-containing protein [Candidatus Thiodiazotropha sp. (ex Myrtea sp. 'scaly one' KF741663)]